jgi:hypothetical protein
LKKFLLFLIAFILIVAATTVPSQTDYNNWLREEIKKQSNNFLVGLGVDLFGGLLDKATTCSNKIFFTVCTTKFSNTEEISAIGTFHNFYKISSPSNGASKQSQSVIAPEKSTYQQQPTSAQVQQVKQQSTSSATTKIQKINSQDEAIQALFTIPTLKAKYKDGGQKISIIPSEPQSVNGNTVWHYQLGEDHPDHFATLYHIDVRSDGMVQDTIFPNGWVEPKDLNLK